MNNMLATYGQGQAKINNKKTAKSQEKLSSGYRVNRSADDAAGLSISEKMRFQIRGLNRGTKNCQDGVSMLQVADGALSETMEIMHRVTELSVQAANGTNSQQDRQDIQKEITQILAETEKVFEDTSFNGEKIFKPEKKVELPEPEYKTPVKNLQMSGDPKGASFQFGADPLSGLSINGTKYPWNSIKSSSGKPVSSLENGRYSVEHEGVTFSFDVEGASSTREIAEALSGSSIYRVSHTQTVETTEDVVSHEQYCPVSSTSVSVKTSEIKTPSDLLGDHTISADEGGISIDGGRKFSWSGSRWDSTFANGGTMDVDFGNGIHCALDIVP
ncbi:MAG: hypothetical protein IJ679_07170, partial [Lachnospiraceae bacterium]|nr:hypothetical protein [Lachnospiraceae bacterium]